MNHRKHQDLHILTSDHQLHKTNANKVPSISTTTPPQDPQDNLDQDLQDQQTPLRHYMDRSFMMNTIGTNSTTEGASASATGGATGTTTTTREKKKYIILTSILLWYTFSVSISIYNKWMFKPSTHFSFPILITSCHQFILFLLSSAVLSFSRKFRFQNPNQTYWMNWKLYCLQILPCSIASAADIGLGNFSFKFITLSLYTMVKSSAIVFVLLWGIVFKLEKMSLKLCAIVGIMTIGVMAMVQGQGEQGGGQSSPQQGQEQGGNKPDPNKLFIGCFLVLNSACMSGLRWALTQILLRRNGYTKNSILTIFYLSPSMCVFLMIVGGAIEGWHEFFTAPIWHEKGLIVTIILLVIPGLLAFCMTLSEFTLLQHAPLLTISIAGIFKELITILASTIIFGDRLNWINALGLLVTLGDMMWYNYYRYQESLTAGASLSAGSSQGQELEQDHDEIDHNADLDPNEDEEDNLSLIDKNSSSRKSSVATNTEQQMNKKNRTTSLSNIRNEEFIELRNV